MHLGKVQRRHGVLAPVAWDLCHLDAIWFEVFIETTDRRVRDRKRCVRLINLWRISRWFMRLFAFGSDATGFTPWSHCRCALYRRSFVRATGGREQHDRNQREEKIAHELETRRVTELFPIPALTRLRRVSASNDPKAGLLGVALRDHNFAGL